MFGLPPGGSEWLIILLIMLPNALIPGWAMYRIARRLGYSGATLALWVVAYIFLGYFALLAFAFAAWPRGDEPAGMHAEPDDAAPVERTNVST